MMDQSIGMLAYLGPETMLPMTSVIAGAIGVVMMFGRKSFRWVANCCRAIVARPNPKASPEATRRPRRIGEGTVGGIVRGEPSRARSED